MEKTAAGKGTPVIGAVFTQLQLLPWSVMDPVLPTLPTFEKNLEI